MEKIDLVLWFVGAGFSVNFTLMLLLFNKLDKLDKKVTDIDRRLCQLQGAFSAFWINNSECNNTKPLTSLC